MPTELERRFQEAVPEPDLALDVDELYRNAQRRRRVRRVAVVAASVLAVVTVAVAGVALIGQPQRAPVIGGGRQPAAVGPPVWSLSGDLTEGWTLRVHRTHADGWCVRPIHGTNRLPSDPDQQPCDPVDPAAADPLAVHGSGEGESGRLIWGIAAPDVTRVTARFPDDPPIEGTVGGHGQAPFRLWAITYPDADPTSVAAFDADGDLLGTFRLPNDASTSEPSSSPNQSPTLDLARLRSVVESEMVEGLIFQDSRTFQDGRGRDHIAVTYSRPHESRSLVIEVIQTLNDDAGWTALVADLNADAEDLAGGYERAISVRDSIIQVSVLTPDGLLTNVYAGSVPPATDAPMPATPKQLSILATTVAQQTDSSGQPQP